MFGSILLLALAWLATSALHRGSVAASLSPPIDAVSAPPTEALAAPVQAAAHHERVADSTDAVTRTPQGHRVHGVLNDLRTSKPIPEVRLALERGTEREVLVTNALGEFRSQRAWSPGPLLVDPTPFANDREDWYSRAVGQPLEFEVLTGGNDPVQLVVDAPAFVILEGVEPPLHPQSRVDARLILSGGERPGWDGTTWVDPSSFRYARDPKWLSDGSLLVAPRSMPSDLSNLSAQGTGSDRVEVTGDWHALMWFATGPLHLRDGRILDDRVRAHDRSSCGSISVMVRDAEGELLRTATVTVTVRAIASLPRPDLPAARRGHEDWARPFAAAVGVPLRLEMGQQPALWTPGLLPVASYEVEVRHPRFEVARQRVQLEVGKRSSLRFDLILAATSPRLHLRATWSSPNAPQPSVSWKLTRLTDDGLPFDRESAASRLGESWNSKLYPERPAAQLEGLPVARFAVELRAESVGATSCFPVPIDPANAILSSDEPLDVLVHNESLRLWRIVLAPDRMRPGDAHGTRLWRLELFDAAQRSAGIMECGITRGEGRVYAPAEDGWTYALTEHGVSSSGRRLEGPWRLDHVSSSSAGAEQVLMIR